MWYLHPHYYLSAENEYLQKSGGIYKGMGEKREKMGEILIENIGGF
jgi:hypothetical protein